MTLKGKKPETIKKRLKMLLYGAAGSGKTMAAIQFAKPYLIDTERGAEHQQYTEQLIKVGGYIFQTTSFDELISEVIALLSEKHDFQTIIIDPLTTIYNIMIDSESKNGTDYGRHYVEVNKKIKRLLNLLLRLDMNVIITAHSKNKYGTDLSVLGQTYDCYNKINFVFDLVLETQEFNKNRIAVVKKSRIKTFDLFEEFNLSYEEIAKRYGKDQLEKEVVTEVLSSKQQLTELSHLIEVVKIPEETVSKWLEKSNSFSFEEMNTATIQKCIDYIKTKLTLVEDVKND
jgi:GTPase SAR1 family protein